MSLNCLTCQNLPRTDSNGKSLPRRQHKHPARQCCADIISRNWSGNLVVPPPYEQMRKGGATKKVKKSHRRLHSTQAVGLLVTGDDAGGGPRLIRSSGMRRDWSLEDIKQRMCEERIGGRIH